MYIVFTLPISSYQAFLKSKNLFWCSSYNLDNFILITYSLCFVFVSLSVCFPQIFLILHLFQSIVDFTAFRDFRTHFRTHSDQIWDWPGPFLLYSMLYYEPYDIKRVYVYVRISRKIHNRATSPRLSSVARSHGRKPWQSWISILFSVFQEPFISTFWQSDQGIRFRHKNDYMCTNWPLHAASFSRFIY